MNTPRACRHTIVAGRSTGPVTRRGPHAPVARGEHPRPRPPDVAKFALQHGRLPRTGEVLVERHLADHFDLKPAARSNCRPTAGTRRRVRRSGSRPMLSPARSQQEVMTSAEQFGVVFAPERSRDTRAAPQHQVALHHDRSQAPTLVAAAASFAHDNGWVVQARSTSRRSSRSTRRADLWSFATYCRCLLPRRRGSHIHLAVHSSYPRTFRRIGHSPPSASPPRRSYATTTSLQPHHPESPHHCRHHTRRHARPIAHDDLHVRFRPTTPRSRPCARRR